MSGLGGTAAHALIPLRFVALPLALAVLLERGVAHGTIFGRGHNTGVQLCWHERRGGANGEKAKLPTVLGRPIETRLNTPRNSPVWNSALGRSRGILQPSGGEW